MGWIISLVVVAVFTFVSALVGHINGWLAFGILAAGWIGASLIQLFLDFNVAVWAVNLFRSTEAQIRALEAKLAALRAK